MNKSTFKNDQKWIALLAAITFAWLLQVSTMPLAATDKTEEAGQASVEQAPGFVEQIGPDWSRPARLKITTVLIIVGAVLVIGIISILINGIGHEAAPSEGMSDSKGSWFPFHPNRT